MILATEMSGPAPDGTRWLRTWSNEDAGTFRIGRFDNDVIAEWVGEARLYADRAGTAVRFEVVAGSDPGWISKMQNGLVAALLRHLSGGMSFHASAVVLRDRAVVFLGDSGAGKSTTVAEFCTRDGCGLLGDDTVALEIESSRVLACPTERLGWLRPQSSSRYGLAVRAHAKTPFLPSAIASTRTELRAIFKLAFDEGAVGCRKVRLPGSAAFELLSGSLCRFVLDEPAVALRDFDALGRLAARVPVYELRRPRSLDVLPTVLEVVRTVVFGNGERSTV